MRLWLVKFCNFLAIKSFLEKYSNKKLFTKSLPKALGLISSESNWNKGLKTRKYKFDEALFQVQIVFLVKVMTWTKYCQIIIILLF